MKGRDAVLILVVLAAAGIAYFFWRKHKAEQAKTSGGVFGTVQGVAGGVFGTVSNVAGGALSTAKGVIGGASDVVNTAIGGVTTGLSKSLPWNW